MIGRASLYLASRELSLEPLYVGIHSRPGDGEERIGYQLASSEDEIQHPFSDVMGARSE